MVLQVRPVTDPGDLLADLIDVALDAILRHAAPQLLLDERGVLAAHLDVFVRREEHQLFVAGNRIDGTTRQQVGRQPQPNCKQYCSAPHNKHSRNVLERWNIGILECWGAVRRSCHYSIIPPFHALPRYISRNKPQDDKEPDHHGHAERDAEDGPFPALDRQLVGTDDIGDIARDQHATGNQQAG